MYPTMASVESITVDSDNDQVVIEGLSIQDKELASYIQDFEPERQEEALERAVRIGTSALQLVDTSKEVEYVDRRFAEMEQEFDDRMGELRDELEQRFDEDGEVAGILEKHLGEDGHIKRHLDDTFGDDGRFAERLQEELGEDGKKIQQALDPDREGTPTHRLKQKIVDEIETVKEQFHQEEGREDVRKETRLKGFDFEDQLEEILGGIVHQTPNRVRDTSEEIGTKGGSKKGDFVISLDETDQRIVVEAKNGAFNGTVESEMREAIENRQADYGIFVARSVEYLPRTRVGWFSEFEQDFVVVALSEDDSEDIEPRFLKFAFHWARTRAMLSSVELGDEIDPEMVKSELDGIEDTIGNFQQIRTKCSDLEDSVKAIRNTLTEIEDDVTSRITRLQAELGGAVE